MDNQNIIAKTKAWNSIMCGYICIRFLDFMLNNENVHMLLVDFHHIALKKMINFNVKNNRGLT